jgi:hypothetical protein
MRFCEKWRKVLLFRVLHAPLPHLAQTLAPTRTHLDGSAQTLTPIVTRPTPARTDPGRFCNDPDPDLHAPGFASHRPRLLRASARLALKLSRPRLALARI